ncbi:MAG: hypothetical protein J5874_00110 [Oscillospiraceae bacterium]|nr:hypothetical protein [Oscillospiraceae bacterium]
MKFGWINAFGAGFVILILIPNIVYALKNKGEKNLCRNRFMNVTEQIGRYACIVLMWLPLLIMKFRFASVFECFLYMAGNGIFLIAYWIVFAIYLKRKNKRFAIVLAILPVCIFLISGILLRHWLLVGFAILFAVGHVYVTQKNSERTETQKDPSCCR